MTRFLLSASSITRAKLWLSCLQCGQLCRVLGQPTEAGFHITELALDHANMT